MSICTIMLIVLELKRLDLFGRLDHNAMEDRVSLRETECRARPKEKAEEVRKMEVRVWWLGRMVGQQR